MTPIRCSHAALAAALTLALCGYSMAQEPPAPPQPGLAAPRAEASKLTEQNVRVDVTITIKTGTKPIVKQLSMVAADGRPAMGRAGIDIPVPTATPVTTYRSVGINVDAVPTILESGRISVRLKLEFSTVYLSDVAESKLPSFGNGSSEVFLIFESGKPIVVSQAMDGESGRDYAVEARATILK